MLLLLQVKNMRGNYVRDGYKSQYRYANGKDNTQMYNT